MSERELRDRLERAEIPGERESAERGWRVVNAAFGDRVRHRPERSRRRTRLAVALATVVALAAIGLTPAGAAVADWVRDTFDPGRDDADPALVSLPAPGRLLVSSDRGPWIVHPDGSKRRLGAYSDADWSPGGLFVAVTRGRQLVAVEPDGDPRWSIARGAPVSRPAWSPGQGFRVAYLSGAELRVVAGDGSGDRALARRVALATPAWRPGAGHVLSYADARGRIVSVDADGGRRLSRSAAGPAPTRLSWTPDGRRLLALSPTAIRVLAPDGSLVRTLTAPEGAVFESLAIDPAGARAAVVHRFPSARRSEVVSRPISGGRARRLFAGDGRLADLAWSPGGRWLLIGWPDADQWLFVRSTGRPKVVAASNISRQFAPGARRADFPRVSGWCCPTSE